MFLFALNQGYSSILIFRREDCNFRIIGKYCDFFLTNFFSLRVTANSEMVFECLWLFMNCIFGVIFLMKSFFKSKVRGGRVGVSNMAKRNCSWAANSML